jgi:hypothetical protein
MPLRMDRRGAVLLPVCGGHVSIRRHWLSDTCTHTNTHKGRRRDESTSQRRSPDRGSGCDAPYTPLLKRRSSGSGAMGSACGGRSRRRLRRGRRPPPNSLTALSRAHSIGTTESRASSIHPSTPTFPSAAAAAPPLRLLQCRPHSIHECGGRLGEGCDCVASTLEGRRDRHVVLVDPVMGAHLGGATNCVQARCERGCLGNSSLLRM